MTALKARQERFCRWFAELGNAAGAARAAGYSPRAANRAGYRLLRHPRVARRIAEIEAETARPHGDGDAVPVGRLETIYRRAIVDHPFHAAARAVGPRARIRRMTPPAAPSARADAGSGSAPFVNFCNGEKTI